MSTLERDAMRCEVNGHLARLHLNRPHHLNAANWTWVQDLLAITRYIAQNAEIRVLLVSGEGRAFCTGLDVKELAQGHLKKDWFAAWEESMMALSQLQVISIAAIHGYCLGGGLQLALACDLRIAADDATFSIPAVKEGLVAALGPMRLARLIGAGPAKYLALLGRRFTAEEGYKLGLISVITPPSLLEEQALTLAKEILSIPFPALLYTKLQIDRAFDQTPEVLLSEMLAAEEACLLSPEHREVMNALRRSVSG